MLGRRGRLALALLLVIPSPVMGQTLVDRMKELFTFGDCGEPLCLAGSLSQNTHGNHFIPAASSSNASVIDFIENAVAVYSSNIPLGSTSSGVTFKFVGGLPVKTSSSSGPIYGERGQTLGRNRFLMGAYMSGINFKTLRGVPIDNMGLNFTHQDVGAPGLGDVNFENDVIHVDLSLYVNLLATSFFVTYGLLDNVDLSVAVPVVHSSMEGRSVGQIVPFGAGTPHFFGGDSANPILRATTATFGSATGIGDVAARLKIGLHNDSRFSAALLADARFPTGDEQNFLGAGSFSMRGMGIFSWTFGGFSPNVNAGYAYRSGDLFNNGVLFNAGFDQLIAPWATLAAEFLSEWQIGDSKLKLPGPVQYILPYQRTVNPTQIPNQRDDRAAASLGFKFRVGPSTLVTNALFPILRGGMSPDIVWTAGAEFGF